MEIIEIDIVWDKRIQRLCERYNKLISKNDTEEISKVIAEIISNLRNFDIEEKKEQKNYILRWGAARALIDIAKNHPNHLENFIHDLEYLAENGYNSNIQERANEVLQILNKPIQEIPKKVTKKKPKKLVKSKPKEISDDDLIRDLQNLLNSIDEIQIKDIAKKFKMSIPKTELWVTELLENGIIKGEISGSIFIPLKKVDYERLENYQERRGKECAICFKAIEIQDPSYCRSCESYFHRDCIMEYAKKYQRCPVCSEVLKWI